jgi:hypothetical protein
MIVLIIAGMGQVRAFCDPDKPLDPSEWGKLRTDQVFTLKVCDGEMDGNTHATESVELGG